MNRNLLHTLFIVLMLVATGCSTEKNTRLSRAYHNVTSHYNVYFNGKESLKAGVDLINQSVEDDFTKLLPIYQSSDPGTGRVAASEMEYAIMKASKLIKVHSITKKPKGGKNRRNAHVKLAAKEEFNNWIDDSYILMGKAYFYMKNYMSAIENLSYVVRKFREEDTRYEASIWLIRCYTELGRTDEAVELIRNIDASADFPSRYDEAFALAVADFHIRQNEFREAIPQLKVAIKKTFRKKNKVRLKYILAQLYQETGQNLLASETFREVARMNPPYLLAFNARINAAGTFAGEGDGEKLKRELHKMLRDSKNYEFRDQIYFAQGNIYMAEGNRPVAIDHYIRSAAAGSVNVYQRALSCLTLADIYFGEKNYKDSQSYYDSAMVVIDETYPDYSGIVSRYNSLTRLTDNLYTIEREDSLQYIAALGEAERNKLISQWISQAGEEQERLRLAANNEMEDRNFFRMNQSGQGLNKNRQESGWYFYNPTTVAYGKVEFEQIWGKRKLEDNWRRSNRNSASHFDAEEPDALETPVEEREPRADDPRTREYYLQDVPLTKEDLIASHQRIRDALFNAGRIFKQDFGNFEQSVQAFEELLKRYHNNIYQLNCYFELWDLYKKTGNQEKSEAYKNLIILHYPESKYARYLVNPDFFIDMEARNDSMNNLYQQAFYNYRQGKYEEAGLLARQIKTMGPDSLLMPKVSFIETIAAGSVADLPYLGEKLNEHIQAFPNSGTVSLARGILKLIEDSTLADYQKLVETGYLNEEIKNEELLPENQVDHDEFGGKFSYDEDLLHYFVIAVPRSAGVDINRLKFDIANYNIDHYTESDFDIETEDLNNETVLVVVRALQDKEQSLIYFRSVIRKRAVFQTLEGVDYVNFVASSYNYREIKADNNYSSYLRYFIKNYSRFITNDFPANELPDPGELMARALRQEEEFEEKGTFVLVKPLETALFTREDDAPQNFVIVVNDPAFDVQSLMPGFTAYHREQFAALNLSVEQRPFGDSRLMIVKSLSGIREAMAYFSKVVANRKLFESLETLSYRNFVITDSNLEKMIAENKLVEYVEFFRKNYTVNNSSKAGVRPGTAPAEKQQAPAKPEEIIPDDPVKQAVAEPDQPAYQGAFDTRVEGKQFFVLIIPKEGIDREAILSAIRKHHEKNFAPVKLLVDEDDFDAGNIVLKVSGINDRESGMNYLRSLVRNQQVYGPLSEVNYRNFIITPDNFSLLLKNKAISDYLEFYKTFYLR